MSHTVPPLGALGSLESKEAKDSLLGSATRMFGSLRLHVSHRNQAHVDAVVREKNAFRRGSRDFRHTQGTPERQQLAFSF